MSQLMLIISVAAMWTSHFLVDMMIGIWPLFKSIAHLDIAVAGLIGGLCAFFGEGMQILFGSLCDRGYRKILIISGLIATTTSAYLIYTDLYLGLFLLYFFTCLGSAAFHPSAASLIGDLPSKNKNILIAIFTSGGYCGMAVSQIIFVQAQIWFDGQIALLAIPAIVIAGLIACSYIGSKQIINPHQNNKHFDLGAFFQFFRQQPLRMLYITQLCSAIMFWGILFLLPEFLLSRGFEDWIALGWGHFCFVLGAVVMIIPAGYLADYYSERKVVLAMIAVAMSAFCSLLFFPFLDSFSVLALLFILGAANGAVNPIVVAFGGHLQPKQKGLVSAFLMGIVWCVAEPVGQMGGGFLATCFESDAPAKSLAILGITFVIGLMAAYRLPEKVVDLNTETIPLSYVE